MYIYHNIFYLTFLILLFPRRRWYQEWSRNFPGHSWPDLPRGHLDQAFRLNHPRIVYTNIDHTRTHQEPTRNGQEYSWMIFGKSDS